MPGSGSTDGAAALQGGALLVVWTDVPPEIEADFNAWYNHEHLPDRVGRLPGFLRGRRYQSPGGVVGAPRFLTLYDLDSAAAMQTDAHVALRRHRRERDRFFVPQFRHTIKGICDVVHRAGTGGGEVLLLLPVTPVAAAAATQVAWLVQQLASLEGITGAVYAVRNQAITAASSAKDDRAGDRYLDGFIAAEARSLEAARVAAGYLSSDMLAQAGLAAQMIPSPCVLRRMFELTAPPAKADGH
jgi:hypothetical protein